MKITHFAVAGLSVALAAAVYLTLNADMDGRMSEMQAHNDKQWQQMQQSLKELKNQPAPAPVKEAVAAASEKLKSAASEAQAAAKELTSDLNDAAAERIAKVKSDVEENIDDVTGAAAKKGQELANTVRSKAGELANGVRDKIQTDPPLLDEDNAADPEAARIAREERNILNATGVGMDRVALETAVAANAVPEGKAFNQIQSLVASQPPIARIKQADKRSDEFVVLDAGMNAKLMKGDRFAVRRGTAIIARVVIGDTIRATESVAEIAPNTLVTGMVLEAGDEIIKFDR